MDLHSHPLVTTLRPALAQFKQAAGDAFYGWKLNATAKRSVQTLMLGQASSGIKAYQQREVEDLDFTLSVYARHQGSQGVGNVNLDPLMPLDAQIQRAFDNAKLASNPMWDLAQPSASGYQDVQSADPAVVEDLSGAHQTLLDSVSNKAMTLKAVQLNSAELYTRVTQSYLETSTGIRADTLGSDIYCEVALEKLPLPNTEEVLQYKKALSMADANLPAFIDDAVAEVLDIGNSSLPKTQDNACILIDKHSIAALLEALQGQMNAQAEYNKGPHFLPGDWVHSVALHPESDSLTLTLDPFLPIMACSTPFTPEGLPASRGLAVTNNRIGYQAVDSRMAAYLNKPVNTVCGNLVVNLGQQSKQALIAAEPECIEVVSFSSLLVNDSTLTWSSEIKLARHYRHGKLVGMIKGGVVSGNIRENFSHFKLSNQQVTLNNIADAFSHALGYVGPNAMLIKAGVKIAGQ